MNLLSANIRDLMFYALDKHTAIPGFNIPYLPMMEPVVRALRDTRCFGLIMVARLEWVKFESGGPGAIYEEYQRVKDERFTRLHMDHVPVIDEDDLVVDYESILHEAITLGYHSVMVDGSRLSLEDNITATKRIVEMAHAEGVSVEAELGAVLGHESGPMPPYDELFESGKGFTDPDEARRFVEETGTDWLSVAIGSVHGAISATQRKEKKVEARLSIPRLIELKEATNIPLVLHGGTGIQKKYIQDAILNGITKINVATAIRQPYEAMMEQDPDKAVEAVYEATVAVIREELNLEDSIDNLHAD